MATITERLAVYGPSTCPICGNERETVFAGSKSGPLTCREHPGHPLYGLGRMEHDIEPKAVDRLGAEIT